MFDMTTPRIEEILNSIGEEHFALISSKKAVIKALTEAHQAGKKAGIDEAVKLLKEKRSGHCGKKDCLQAYCINRKIIREFCDDAIKALQDNKS